MILKAMSTFPDEKSLSEISLEALGMSITYPQGAPKIFLSTCPSDKHYIKFGCPKPKGSCPKSFAQNSKTIGHIFYCLLSHN